MNNERRKEIDLLIDRIEGLRFDIEGLKDDEQGAFDGMPESLQAGERGELMETAIAELDEAIESLGLAMDNLGNARGVAA